MNTKKILTSLLATVLLAGAMTVSAWAADATVTTEAELKAALEGAVEGDVITVDGLVELTEDITIGNGITLVGNDLKGSIYAANDASVTVNIPSATLIASGDITFVGENIVNSFNPYWYNNTITIGKNASLSVVGAGRMTVGYGNVFVIEGNISNAKTTNKEDVVPSLSIPAGISINGSSGASFIAKDAYVSFGLTQSKNYGASGDFEISFENCIVDFSNNLTFSTSTQGATPKFDVEFVDSIMNFEKNLDFANEACNVLVDNSVVTIGSSFRNDGKLDIVNGSEFTVEYQIQPGEHGGHSGTITVDDSEFTIECTSTGHAFDGLGTGVIIAKNGATLDIDYVKDASVLKYGDSTVITQNDGLIGESEVIADPVAEVDGTYYTDLQTALKAMTTDSVLTLLDDITITDTWDCRYTGAKILVPVTINGNGKTLKFTGAVSDKNWETIFRFEANATVNDLTIDVSEATNVQRGISSKGDIAVDNFTFIGNGSSARYGVIYGEGAGANIGNVTATIANSSFADCSYGVSDNRNGQDIKSASVTDCIFENASALVSASTSIVFNNNKVESGKVLLYANENTSDLTVTAKGNTLDKDYENRIDDGKIIDTDNDFALPAVMIGANGYFTIEDAIASASSDDTITITAGTYDAFEVPATKNNLTFVGETAKTKAATGNLVTIKTLEDGIDTHNGGVFVQAETTTFKNINFTAGTTLGASSGWMSSSLGNTNGDTGKSSSLKNLTVDSCNFTGSGVQYAIWTNQGNVTLTNCTITNYATAVDNYAIGADQKVVINDSVITDVYNAFHTGEAAAGAQINVTGTEIDAEAINIGGGVAVTVAGSTIRNADITSYATSTFSVSESALYDTSFAVANDGKITLSAVYANNMNELTAANEASDKIDFISYYPTVEDLKDANVQPIAVPDIADAIYVKFEKADVENGIDTDEQADLYNINLVADAETINRLNSVDLTFVLTQKTGNNEFEIIASNDEIVINPVNNSTDRYEFHYDGKDGVKTDTGALITIGQVKFTGYGIYSFAVDATATTNAAHATTIGDNIVDTFLPNGDTTTVADGELVIDDDTVTDILIAVPTRDLTINIDFPNAVKADNNYKYQDMKVVVSGGELSEAIVIDLGADATMPALTTEVKTTAKAEVAITDKYVVTLTDVLEVNNAYNVEVSGAGYRSVKYTVTMTEDKTLNFWNNVKDNETAIEEGKKTAKVTYLAGDIVKDGTINVYDLSAVVSYFGEIDLNAAGTQNTYAKYDLNRDGKIDSKDVAYVLVSWNN